MFCGIRTSMSNSNIEDAKDLDFVDRTPKVQVNDDPSSEDPKHSNENEEYPMPSAQQEEEVLKKKYGGFLKKKSPLISKDHERAFFDSADWALGKQGAQKSKNPLEALRPKLQPTPHQQARSRRSSYAPTDESEVDGGNTDVSASEDQNCTVDGDNIDSALSEDQSLHN